MPETGFGEPITILATDVKKEAGEKGFLLSREVLNLVTRHNLRDKYLGSGAECVVVGIDKESPQGEELAAAFTYVDMPPLVMKRVFYAQRIMSTLFPHNFPHFYAAFGKHPQQENSKNITGTIRRKVITNPVKYDEQRSDKTLSRGKYPFSKVNALIEQQALPIHLDESDVNYGVGPNGSLVYLDNIVAGNEWDVDGLMRYMEESGHSKRDRQIVAKSIERLQELNQSK